MRSALAVVAFALSALTLSPIALGQTAVLREGDSWDFFRGIFAPPVDWAEPEFDAVDSGWETGVSGFGYGDDDDATILDDMQNSYSTVYLRTTVEIGDELDGAYFSLRIRYDDGFVAYLDGEEFLRRNVLGVPPTFDEFASGQHDIITPDGFDEQLSLEDIGVVLEPGEYVLAVEVHNATIDSSDLSFSAEIDGSPFVVTGLEPAFGPLEGENAVAVLGRGFDDDDLPSVRFGATPASDVTFVSDQRLDVVVPSSAFPGAVDVTIEDSRGAVTLTDGYRYNSGRFGLQFGDGAFASASGVELSDIGGFEIWFRLGDGGFFNSWRILLAMQAGDGSDAFRIEAHEGEVRAITSVNDEDLTLQTGVPLPIDEWHHVACTFSPSGRSLYFDGRLVARDGIVMFLPEDAPLRLGTSFENLGFFGPQPFNGAIESARVWNVERSEIEIASGLYRELSSETDGSELEAAWPLVEGGGQVAGDLGQWDIPLVLGASESIEGEDPEWTPVEDFPTFAVSAVVPASGPLEGGDPVRVFGVGFSGDSPAVVIFGDSDATDVRVVDDSTIEATVPPGDAFGAVDVRVEAPAGAATLLGGYAYVPAATFTKVAEGDLWHYARGTVPPPFDWNLVDFDPEEFFWESGPTGIGYGDGDDATELVDMQNGYVSVYARREFELPGEGDRINYLRLRLRFDDGFVAYLNGVEIARENVDGQPPAFDELASDLHEILGGAGTFDTTLDLLADRTLLRAGKNVLAIEVHNATLDSSDLSLSAELVYSAPGRAFVRGDVDESGSLTISDAVLMLLHAYSGHHALCSESADVDNDGRLSVTDAVVLLDYLFQRGRQPASPFPSAEPDLDDDEIDCGQGE